MCNRFTGMRITRVMLICSWLGGCVASELPAPPAHSPASVQAQEAAPRRIASSLASDPLAAPAASDPPAAPAHHHHHAPEPHSHAAPHEGSRALAADSGSTAPPADGGTPAPRVKTEYVCPMHPEVRQAQPGRCPKCGMQLAPKPMPEDSRAHPKSSSVQARSTPVIASRSAAAVTTLPATSQPTMSEHRAE